MITILGGEHPMVQDKQGAFPSVLACFDIIDYPKEVGKKR